MQGKTVKECAKYITHEEVKWRAWEKWKAQGN